MDKKIKVRAKKDINIDIMMGIMFETIYSKFNYVVSKVTKDEVTLHSIEKGSYCQLVTLEKDKFKELLTSGELIAL